MMRLSGCLGCAIAAFDCGEKALGAMPQTLFASDNLWIWWIAAGSWAIAAVRFPWWRA